MQVLNSVKYDLIFVLLLKYVSCIDILIFVVDPFRSWILLCKIMICMAVNVFFVGEESGFALNNV